MAEASSGGLPPAAAFATMAAIMWAIIQKLRIDDDEAALRYGLMALVILAAILTMLPELPGALKSG